MNEHYIVLFDGVCNLCNGYINFLIDRDYKDRFRFCSIQSESGIRLLEQYDIARDLSTIILIKRNTVHRKSTAILHILRELRPPISWTYGFLVIPVFARDWLYSFIAKHRYNWFGKADVCRLPTAESLKKFL